MNLIDKDAVIAEIERRRDAALMRQRNLETIGDESILNELIADGLNRLIAFIDSLPEEHNEDLEEEINRFLDEDDNVPSYSRTARHFAEWQKEKDSKDNDSKDNDLPNVHHRDDLDEYAYQCAYDMSNDWAIDNPTWTDIKTACKLGAEWQRQQLMKDAVLETKVMVDCDGDGIETPYEQWLTLEDTEIPYIPDNLGLKEGDKVKIIIVKTE